VVLAGYASAGSGNNTNFAVVRLNADGSPDPSFGGGDGIVTELIQAGDKRAWDVAVQTDGKILVAGGAGFPPLGPIVIRLTPAGALDSTFSGDGIARAGTTGEAQAVKVQGDGKIVIAGSAGPDFLTARLTTSGDLDTTFSSDGLATTDFASS